jgi:predicted Zn-dependent protease
LVCFSIAIAEAQTPSAYDSASPSVATTDVAKEKAKEQLTKQEHQRILGVIPEFNTSNISDAVGLIVEAEVSSLRLRRFWTPPHSRSQLWTVASAN